MTSPKTAKALWFEPGGQIGLREEPLPAPPDTILLKSLYSAVSYGTERLVLGGLVPQALYESMAVPFMAGSFKLPVKYGYSLVAEVLEGPAAGQTVHLMHPHQDYCRVPGSAVTVLPAGLPPLRATLIANLETALTACWDAGLKAGQSAAVVGFGFIGSLTAQTAKLITGTTPVVFESDPRRRELIAGLGFTVATELPIDCFDAVFHTSATGAGLSAAVQMVKPESPVIELSWYGDREVSVALGSSFHYGRKKIIGSQVAHIPPAKQPQFDYASRKAEVIRLLEDAVWDGWTQPPVADIKPLSGAAGLYTPGRGAVVPIITYEENNV